MYKKSQPLLSANTPAWTFQCWASFVISTLLLTRGIYLIEVNGWVRGFLMMACLFTVGATFTLSKTIRDNRDKEFDTPAWMFFAWASFAASVIATMSGVYWLPAEVSGWPQGFFLATFLFQINTAFTLSKCVRDNYEAAQLLHPRPTVVEQANSKEMRLPASA